ncbi:hypothetical protein JYU34_002380 [Plutella xylostella]|uniref:Glycosyl transferase CAP10 domain-containing protein n=1 Tax=Plutella xylostella TaxID=51655 RepID=A0ABQ7R223_PLUXY|nr:hypothetical protein JYU34_002380 [Plutella xylostella]
MNKIICACLMVLIIIKQSVQNVVINGPGLKPDKIVMPARYFIVNFTSFNDYTTDMGKEFAVDIHGQSYTSNHCRVWANKLDRKDGTFIIRYKVYETCRELTINIYYKSKHIAGSPLQFSGPIYADHCNCPERNIDKWLNNYGCKDSYKQIEKDLKQFVDVDMNVQIKRIIDKHHRPESTSFCHYVVKNNQIHRDCYGKHVGFNMFSDNILLYLTRKVEMPDMELVINLGDWPLARRDSDPLPIFSWCGSDDTLDIVMPTYDITESTLENMGRVSLDMLSVQGNVQRAWAAREARAVWRGRDSRAERLKLIDIAREHPHLFNASLTNYFFFRDKEAQYGPKQPHISFFKFFDYKYQINIDGTVAAYRMPYLLGGGGMVLKQDSPYYEHFYHSLEPWVHYVPVARDLSDLVQRIEWAKDHDEDASKIAKNARQFANDNLLPQHIICYHAVLFKEWSKRLVSKVSVREGMTAVPQPSSEPPCSCNPPDHQEKRDEL